VWYAIPELNSEIPELHTGLKEENLFFCLDTKETKNQASIF
jgi:hypothetical protein